MSTDQPDDGVPVLRFVAGSPTPEEVAAVTAVLLARQDQQDLAARAAGGRRAQFRRMRLGLRLRPGRGAWRGTKPEA